MDCVAHNLEGPPDTLKDCGSYAFHLYLLPKCKTRQSPAPSALIFPNATNGPDEPPLQNQFCWGTDCKQSRWFGPFVFTPSLMHRLQLHPPGDPCVSISVHLLAR